MVTASFLTSPSQKRYAGRYRVEGEKGYRMFNIEAENKESVVSEIQTLHIGFSISEFRAHEVEL